MPVTPNISVSYNWVLERCNNPNVGYSQRYRNGQTINGITYYDCSSLMWYGLIAGGFDCVGVSGGSQSPFVTNAFSPSNMQTVLRNLGFAELNANQPWTAGDILWRQGHTEMAFSYNRSMGAHTDSVPLGQQVAVNANPTPEGQWSKKYRYGAGATPRTWIKGNRYLNIADMNNNALIVYWYFAPKNWSRNAIAALLGNMVQESTINPGLWQSLTPNDQRGWGLVQWTPATKYFNWCDPQGFARDDGDHQLEWIDTMTAPTGQWNTAAYPMTWEEFKVSTESPEYLALVFCDNFEQPHPEDANYEYRKERARYYYDWLEGQPVFPPNPEPIPTYRTGLPVWMYTRKWKGR